jgi:radical SAM protein with 4Fe4S-binding SPASM domain
VTTTEAPQLRRVALQRQKAARGVQPQGHRPTHAAGIRDGNGIMFISHVGDISPSGFLEMRLGNVRYDNVVEVYRDSWLFRELRDPEHFYGRCGECEFHWVCGGSRARAYAATGNPLGEDPLCTYIPTALLAATGS